MARDPTSSESEARDENFLFSLQFYRSRQIPLTEEWADLLNHGISERSWLGDGRLCLSADPLAVGFQSPPTYTG